MADGSIQLKAKYLSKESVREIENNKNPVLEKLVDQGGFDISACVGSPEKLPEEPNALEDTNYMSLPQYSSTKVSNVTNATVMSHDPLSKTDS